MHPVSFIVTGAVTSLTFSLLIYSLTISFGDIGKALAVVVMVLQIAGSGGTYPIERCRHFQGSVYFLPIPICDKCDEGVYRRYVRKHTRQMLYHAFTFWRSLFGDRTCDTKAVYQTQSFYREAYGRF